MKKHHKYPHQRVEQRRNLTDPKSVTEQKQMQERTTKISIGILTIFPPKPDTEITSFTLAFPKAIPKSKLYPQLEQALNEYWDGEPTKSVFLHLSKPLPLSELRRKVKESLEGLLQS